MKITLRRKLELKSQSVYLKLHRKVLRNDIKGYLNSEFDFPNEIIAGRIKDYLRNVGIYDSNYGLTATYRDAKETGLIKEPDEGKYQIWHTQGDLLFGDRFFCFKRMKPDSYKSNNIKKSELKLTGVFHSLPVKGGAEQDLEFTIEEMGKWDEKKEPSEIDCTWIWNNTDNSEFKFSGFLKINGTDKKWNGAIDETKSLDLNISLVPHIPNILPGWNSETERYGMKMDDIKDEGTYLYFEYTGSRPCAGYLSCHYEKVPVEPYNLEEAKAWRDKLIHMELEKEYKHPSDFAGSTVSINQKDGFARYIEQLDMDMPKIEQYSHLTQELATEK